MNKTNIYVANYDDLSQLTINAVDMKSAVQGLKFYKDEEPQLLRRTITGVITPNKVLVEVVAESTSLVPLPSGIVVRPTQGEFYENDEVTLYVVPVDRATFVGWYANGELLSTETEFKYTVPSANVVVSAKFDVEPLASVVLTVNAELEEGSTASLEGIYVRPSPGYSGTEGEKVWLYMIQDITSTATFLGWYDGDTLVSSATEFEYTLPSEDVTITAKFE